MTPPRLLYIHGFASSGAAKKAQNLRAAFGEDRVLAPSLPVDPLAAWDLLVGLAASVENPADNLLLVGTSQGGYYADLLSRRFRCRALLINPLIKPERLRKYVGTQTNFNTGQTFEYTARHVEDTVALRPRVFAEYPEEQFPVVLVADDDELLDPEEMAGFYLARGCTVHRYPTGGHRLEIPGAMEARVTELLG